MGRLSRKRNPSLRAVYGKDIQKRKFAIDQQRRVLFGSLGQTNAHDSCPPDGTVCLHVVKQQLGIYALEPEQLFYELSNMVVPNKVVNVQVRIHACLIVSVSFPACFEGSQDWFR